MARVKLRLGELDDEYRALLHQAVEFGPWYPDAVRPIAELGLASWLSLEQPERRLVLEAAHRAVQLNPRDARQLEQLAIQTGTRGLLCGALEADLRARAGVCY